MDNNLIGHQWVKERYIDPTDKGKKTYVDEISGNKISFVPATVYDNYAIMMNDPAYARRLENLPPKKRAAFLLGDWDVYDGQAFEEWDPDIHVIEPFTIPEHWIRWISVDNGYSDPFAWYWFTVDEEGFVYIYREFTRLPKDPKLTYSDQAQMVINLSTYTKAYEGQAVEVIEPYGVIYAGHDAFKNITHLMAGKTISYFYQQAGLLPVVSSVPDRRLRKSTWHEYLKPFEHRGKMVAKVRIFNNCKNLIETLPKMCEDEKDSEKVMESSKDHWYDGCLTGDTIVNTTEGNIPIAELVGKTGQVHCYDVDNKSPAISKYHDVRATRKDAEIYEVEVEDGRTIKATGDHQILTQGGWKPVMALTEEDFIVDIADHL